MFDILSDYVPEVSFTKRNDSLETLIANRPDKPFSKGVQVRLHAGSLRDSTPADFRISANRAVNNASRSFTEAPSLVLAGAKCAMGMDACIGGGTCATRMDASMRGDLDDPGFEASARIRRGGIRVGKLGVRLGKAANAFWKPADGVLKLSSE